MKKVFFLVLLLGTTTFVFSGCSTKEGEVEQKEKVEKIDYSKLDVEEPPFDTSLPGEDGIKNTIQAYNLTVRNALLADAYFKLLRKYATEKEIQRVFIDVEFDSLKGVAMRSWQRELVFENISVSDSAGYAETFERWEFEYVDLKTKEITEPIKKVEYKLKYDLEREEDRWVVSKIREREPSVLIETIELKLKEASK